ncbi:MULTISPECIES: E2 domain-containing protein [Stenotrophomonas]|uniref:E2 domain-containing protein n=1 Tax=Stenotrophomonas TaxID=40323 RepID=UPI0034E0650A
MVRAGGAEYAFRLLVSVAGEHVSVREIADPGMLPGFCPDRHINGDRSFCLGWGEDNPSRIQDEAAARHWWATVYQYLTYQIGANARRVFPGAENGRAHGRAAQHQANAEQAAERLGPAFKADVLAGQFMVRKDSRPQKRRLELWHGKLLLARVSTRTETLVGRPPVCPCGRDPDGAITACGDHAAALVTFILEQHRCALADTAFLEDCAAAGARCCGTLDICGLRSAIKRTQTVSLKTENSPRARTSKFWRPPAKSKRPR